MSSLSNQAQRKFRRADEHIDVLHKSTRRWVSNNTNAGFIEDDPKTGERVLRIKLNSRPPVLDWGVVIGDAIHNMRSGLDQLAWLLGGNPPTNPKSSEFPIYIDPAQFRNRGRQAIRSIPKTPRELITDIQPCNRFQTMRSREKDPLWILHQCSNIDKHHSLHLGVLTAANRPTGIKLSQTFVGPLEHDNVVGRWAANDPNRPRRAKHRRLSLFIAFDPEGPALGRPAVDCLRAISAYIDQAVFSLLLPFL